MTSHPSVRWIALAGALVLLGAIYFVGRLRSEHLVLLPLFAALPFAGPRAARLWSTAAPFILVIVLYDLFVLLLPLRGEIHVADLHAFEARLFSITAGGERLILPEYFASRTHPALDLLCGLAYATYILQIVVAALFLHRSHHRSALMLALGFLTLNVLGMAIWLFYPAAPPWYVAAYGLGPADLSAAPSAAGAARFDELLGIGFFEGFYARNVNVFGAMPSLHVAYPTLVACVLRPVGPRVFAAGALFALLVAFSAVYLVHHYVLDVLAGVGLALVVFACIDRWLPRPESAGG